ncbi:MAG: hypothetical protein R6X35_12080, partial [Candidatus Krumholzibacteriia bacterium]
AQDLLHLQHVFPVDRQRVVMDAADAKDGGDLPGGDDGCKLGREPPLAPRVSIPGARGAIISH